MSITRVDAEEFIKSTLQEKCSVLMRLPDVDVKLLRVQVGGLRDDPQMSSYGVNGEGVEFAMRFLDEELWQRMVE